MIAGFKTANLTAVDGEEGETTVECHCGKQHTITDSAVLAICEAICGRTKPKLPLLVCGCVWDVLTWNSKLKGMSKSNEYKIWYTLRARCHDKSDLKYNFYGKKGFRLCASWRGSFAAFLKDMGFRPSDRHILSIIPGKFLYNKQNTVWTTRTDRHDSLIGFNQHSESVRAKAEKISAETQVPVQTIRARILNGWSESDLRLPIQPRGKSRGKALAKNAARDGVEFESRESSEAEDASTTEGDLQRRDRTRESIIESIFE